MSPKEVRSIDCAGGLKIFNHGITSVLNMGLHEFQTSNFWVRDLNGSHRLDSYELFVFYLVDRCDQLNTIATRSEHQKTTTSIVCFSCFKKNSTPDRIRTCDRLLRHTTIVFTTNRSCLWSGLSLYLIISDLGTHH